MPPPPGLLNVATTWGGVGEALFALTGDAVVLVDARQVVVDASPAYARRAGTDPAALRGAPLHSLLHPSATALQRAVLDDVQPRADIELALAGAAGRPWRATLRSRTLSGSGGRLLVFAPCATDAGPGAASALELAVDVARVGVYRYDLQQQRVYFNDHGWAQIRMAPRPDGIAVAELDILHPDDVATVRAAADRAIATGEPVDAQARYLLPGGEVRHIFSRRFAQRDADGQPLALVGVVLDLTEQVRQNERSQALTRRLDELCATLGIGLWGQDDAGLNPQWNAQMWALYDLPVQPQPPSLPELLRLRVHPDDRDEVYRRLLEWADSDRATIELDYRVLRSHGEERRLAVVAQRRRIGGRAPVYGIVRDVTEHHAAERALREASERIALATRAVGLGTWQYDVASGRRRWDDTMYVLRGLAPRAGPPDEALRVASMHPEDRERVLRMHAEVASECEPRSYEFRVCLPGGEQRTLAARTTPLLDAAGRVTSILGVNWDVSEARAAQQALMARDVAERESRAKSKFLARMSHELRTPLNAVLGFTQLLRAQLADARQREQLDHVRLAGEHLLSLINDTLDLARVQAGELALSLEPVDLDALLPEVVALAEPLARTREIVIAVTGSAGSAQADPVRLRQVLINLVSNAVKYNRRGGRVDIDTRCEAGRVLLAVRDTGVGLTPAQLERLFEPFNRLGAEASGIEGTGIGLAIVQGLVERMGGSIQVRSTPGVGSEFRLDLPGAVGLPSRPDGGPAFGASLHGGLDHAGRVLYIEDNPVNVLLVTEMLAQYTRFELVTAAAGEEGVARAATSMPDLVLVDMQLPDIDGFEVLRRLRADPATAALRCIALSANALPADIERARAAGFDDYWTKPIDLKRFLEALDAVFAAG